MALPRRRERLDAIVIGAGVVGSTLALMLARDGLRIALVEAREPMPWRREAPDLRVYALAPDSIAQFEALGLWAAIRARRVQPYRRMCVWDAAGGGELAFDADAIGRDSLGAIVEHGLLVDTLWHALAAEPNLVRYCPDRLQALSGDQDHAIATLDSGLELRAPLLVAADGGDSKARALAAIEVARRDYGQRALVAYVDCERPHQATAWQRFLPGGPLALLPCDDRFDPSSPRPGARVSIVWSLPEAEAARLLEAEPAEFERELTRGFDARLGELRLASARAAFPLYRRLAKHYVQGRVVLAGDAAHVVHPLAGQGVNLGLRDVACLHRVLTAASGRDLGAAHRLQRYARERRSENTLAAWTFEGLHRLFANDAMLPTLLRGPLLGAVGRVPPLVEWFRRRAAGG